jgi:signal peptidase I
MARIAKAAFFTLIVALVAATVAVAARLIPYTVYVIHTGSMTPTITPASAVIVHRGVYHVGQPVSYWRGDQVITHRLIAINPNRTITTKGDANSTPDPWHVPVANIIGGVVAAPPFLGWAFIYLQQPPGFASVLLAILCVVLVFSIARDIDRRPPPAPA